MQIVFKKKKKNGYVSTPSCELNLWEIKVSQKQYANKATFLSHVLKY